MNKFGERQKSWQPCLFIYEQHNPTLSGKTATAVWVRVAKSQDWPQFAAVLSQVAVSPYALVGHPKTDHSVKFARIITLWWANFSNSIWISFSTLQNFLNRSACCIICLWRLSKNCAQNSDETDTSFPDMLLTRLSCEKYRCRKYAKPLRLERSLKIIPMINMAQVV